MTGIEMFGYLASLIVALSLMMKNINKLRWWNLTGASLFSIYGFMIGAWPVFILNGFIAIADIYYLRQLYLDNDSFSLFPVHIEENEFLEKFLDFYFADIKIYFPKLHMEQVKVPSNRAYFILRDMMPVSLIIYKQSAENIHILIDYAIPAYRDLKNARFFYHLDPVILGIPEGSRFKIESHHPAHIKYLKKMAFTSDKQNPNIFFRKIK